MQPSFGVMANGAEIDSYPLPNPPVYITYSFEYEQLAAARHAGLTYEQYMALPGTPLWSFGRLSKAEVIIFYRKSLRIEAVSAEAQARAMKPRRR